MCVVWEVFLQVFTLFALMGAGFWLCRRGLFGDAAARGVAELLVRVVTPCLIVEAFQRPCNSEMLGRLGAAFACSLAIQVGSMLLAAAAFRRLEGDGRVLRFAVVFSNAGFMGIPLEQAILGSEGVFYGAAFVAVFNVLCWSWGLWTVSGDRRELSLRRLLVNPGLLGIAVGLPLFFASVRIPAPLDAPVKMLSDLNTPLAMVLVGAYLARADYSAAIRRPAAWAAAALRLVAVPALVVCAFWALVALGVRMDPTLALAMAIPAAAPVAALTTIFSVRYRRNTALSAGLVAGTTLLSILTLPPMVALAHAVVSGVARP